MKRKLYSNKGVTLIALTVTIVLLIILAGITFSVIPNDLFEEQKQINNNIDNEIHSLQEEIDKTKDIPNIDHTEVKEMSLDVVVNNVTSTSVHIIPEVVSTEYEYLLTLNDGTQLTQEDFIELNDKKCWKLENLLEDTKYSYTIVINLGTTNISKTGVFRTSEPVEELANTTTL